MGRSVSDAAAQAVAKSNKKETKERTITEVIAQARNNASSGLAVTSADILTIIGQLDSFRTQLVQATNALQAGADTVDILGKENEVQARVIVTLTEQNEQFRKVYELENRSSSVTVEKVDEFGQPKAEIVVGTNSGGDVAADVLVAAVAGGLPTGEPPFHVASTPDEIANLNVVLHRSGS